jgi:hypothetical protein
MKLENVLLVAGSGRNSGKTTIVCRLIEQFQHLGITSVKISPHFHDTSEGLVLRSSSPEYRIYKETNRNTPKDSSRMLNSGAEMVYFIQTPDTDLNKAFTEVYNYIAPGNPVICESPALINFMEPGLFILMISPEGSNFKNIENMRKFTHIESTYEEIVKPSPLPITFIDGKWKSLK